MIQRAGGTSRCLTNAKEPGTISHFRIMEYFRICGHEGFPREMLYHLLLRQLFSKLMEHKVIGKLDQVFFF